MTMLQSWRGLLLSSLLTFSVIDGQVISDFPSAAPTFFNASDLNQTLSPAPSSPPTSDANGTTIPTLTPTLFDGNTTAPTATPTMLQTTKLPTFVPTANVTENATSVPTSFPSASPTVPPSNATDLPTLSPSESPSKAPTASPTDPLQDEALSDLSISLFGISTFPETDWPAWQNATANFQKQYYASVMNSPIVGLETEVQITGVVLPQPNSRGLRQLQGQDVVSVIYSQTMQYRSVDQNFSPSQVALLPFETEVGRNAYVELLKGTGQGVLVDVTSSSSVVTDATPQPSAAPLGPTARPTQNPASTKPAEDGGGLGTGAIVGIAVGGGVALIAILLFFFFRSGDNDYEGANDPPPSVNVKRDRDEVSTLAAPPMGGPPTSHESLADYGEQSVATVDYDYSKAYGGGGDTSVVSSAGGTFGSHTQTLQSVLDPATASATGAALGGAGSFSDGDSFEAAYRDPNANVKEELLNIFAPPGKLGVVIDTPDDGAPVVHAVKDSSVIADKIHVGDKLVAVDDEDVRSMTAIKVSKLISRKSANPSRKLTIIRTTVIE